MRFHWGVLGREEERARSDSPLKWARARACPGTLPYPRGLFALSSDLNRAQLPKPLTSDLLTTLFGLALLLAGGDVMVRGASALAHRLGVSPLAIGLTVVAFGTSAPELAVNLTAAVRGNGAMSFGNIMGSNMANIGLIVAATALYKPLHVQSPVIVRELPMMLLATAAAAVLGLDAWLRGSESLYDRSDGLILLLLFTVFVYYTVNDVIAQRRARAPEAAEPEISHRMSRSTALGLTVAGLAALIFGAELTVDGAVGLARGWGVSEAIIGLTLVAIGTSLPELTTSLIATAKGFPDLAIGNVVGSNIFNLLLVLGASATLRPVPVPEGGALDLAIVGFLSLVLLITSYTRGQRIIRTEAVLLGVFYLGYMAYRIHS
ncbi:MAG: calcium/sodium antiporter [Deltaproteobacteria bacterium]|nr:calcium/sodium antiporter [Deltaproteobacteria bacterium]MBW2396608.1 calcium/sodium antiporter [Deltaproteobacteria bacterium]